MVTATNFDVKKETWNTTSGIKITKIVARYNSGSRKGQIFAQQTINQNEDTQRYQRIFKSKLTFTENAKIEILSQKTGVRRAVSRFDKPLFKGKRFAQVGVTLFIRKKYDKKYREFSGFSSRANIGATGQDEAERSAIGKATGSGYVKYEEWKDVDHFFGKPFYLYYY
jgi:hypothetical protein